ncbi:MAG: DUF3459 domain-containing protein [Clostridiales bacterium]|nr:DUF3459 domain-containing protein [Clostridiales bacterium]
MHSISFNSQSGLDRLPSGAVCAETKIRVGLRILEEFGANAVTLVLKSDDSGSERAFPLEKVWSEKGYDRFEGDFDSGAAGLYWYHFRCEAEDGFHLIEKSGKEARFCDRVSSFWQLTVYDRNFSTPDWIKGGVFYHIFVDRFFKGADRPHHQGSVFRSDWGGAPRYQPDEYGEIRNNDFFGGNLDGVIAKLPYLHELGVSCIYLSPIFEASSNHKYDTADYMEIDPSFGDDETFALLCTEAEKLGIRIICDGVFNHSGADSVYFDKFGHYGGNGAYNSKSSPYYKWYSFANWPDDYDCWWGIKNLPRLRVDEESCRDFILGRDGVLEKWMSLGCSGWRLDVADELTESFLCALRSLVKEHDSGQLIIGEVWEDASNKIAYGRRRHYFLGKELDGVMNYPLKNGIINYVMTGNAENLREVVETLCENYPKPALDCLMNILGTHDTERIITVLGGRRYSSRDERANAFLTGYEYEKAREKLYIASLLQFTLPGVPCIFYGDEAGLQGYEDPFCRRCFPWGNEDAELTHWYKALARLRRETPALHGGDYQTLTAKDGLYTFRRSGSGQIVYVSANLGREDHAVSAPRSAAVSIMRRCKMARDGRLIIEPMGCLVLKEP